MTTKAEDKKINGEYELVELSELFKVQATSDERKQSYDNDTILIKNWKTDRQAVFIHEADDLTTKYIALIPHKETKEKINYLYYVLSINVGAYWRKYKTGQHARASVMQRMKIPLHTSEDTQRYLYRSFAQLEKRKKAIQKLKSLCEDTEIYMTRSLLCESTQTEPEIRFCGFDGEWVQHKMGDIAEVKAGSTPNTKDPTLWGGNIDWYTPTEVGNTLFLSSSTRRITHEGLRSCSASLLPAGSIIASEIVSNTRRISILAKDGSNGRSTLGVIPCREKVNTYFLYALMDTLKKQIHRMKEASLFERVLASSYAKMDIMMPPTWDEMKKIDELFEKLCRLIELYRQRAEQIEKIEKYIYSVWFA